MIDLGSGYVELMASTARWALDEAEDISDYQIYADMARPFHTRRMLHGSDNREEL